MSKVACPGCGLLAASSREVAKYHYRESGLDNVWLHGGVTETVCSKCGKKFVRVWKEAQLLQVIAIGLLIDARNLNGSELRFLRRACGLSQDQLAAALKCPRRATVAEREAKEKPGLSFPEEVGVRLVLLKLFNKHLAVPGNSALEANQLRELWDFSAFFQDLAGRVQSHRSPNITVEVRNKVWAVSSPQQAA